MNIGLNYTNHNQGVHPVVTRVDDKGPADEAGVRVGEEILAVDDMSMADVLQILASDPGEEVTLLMKEIAPSLLSSLD